MNLVERWFAEYHGVFRGPRPYRHRAGNDIRKWINEWNKDPKPFVWTKSADLDPETLLYRNELLATLAENEAFVAVRSNFVAFYAVTAEPASVRHKYLRLARDVCS